MDETKNNEPGNEALDGLNDNDRKETQEIIDSLKPDDTADGKDKKPEEPKPEEGKDKKPEDSKPDEKKPDEKVEKKPEDRRPGKLIPAWVHERAKSEWETKEKDLMGQIEAASKGAKPADGAEKPDKEAVIKALAEKHGYEPEFVRDLLELTDKNGGVLPAEVAEKLHKIDKLSSDREAEVEEAKFSSDFDKIILPLIKAEYGDDAPANVISDIKEDLKGIAYSPEFGKVPYEMIYKGNDQFRELIPAKKKGAESSRPGTETVVLDGALDLTKPLTDAEVKGLSDSDFDKYSANMEKYEKSLK